VPNHRDSLLIEQSQVPGTGRGLDVVPRGKHVEHAVKRFIKLGGDDAGRDEARRRFFRRHVILSGT
jgi:hypothetical protein